MINRKIISQSLLGFRQLARLLSIKFWDHHFGPHKLAVPIDWRYLVVEAYFWGNLPTYGQTYGWLMVWNMFFVPFSWEFRHPNWRTHSIIFRVGWNHQPAIIIPIGISHGFSYPHMASQTYIWYHLIFTELHLLEPIDSHHRYDIDDGTMAPRLYEMPESPWRLKKDVALPLVFKWPGESEMERWNFKMLSWPQWWWNGDISWR